jgi:hypothetical protein
MSKFLLSPRTSKTAPSPGLEAGALSFSGAKSEEANWAEVVCAIPMVIKRIKILNIITLPP